GGNGSARDNRGNRERTDGTRAEDHRAPPAPSSRAPRWLTDRRVTVGLPMRPTVANIRYWVLLAWLRSSSNSFLALPGCLTFFASSRFVGWPATISATMPIP